MKVGCGYAIRPLVISIRAKPSSRHCLIRVIDKPHRKQNQRAFLPAFTHLQAVHLIAIKKPHLIQMKDLKA